MDREKLEKIIFAHMIIVQSGGSVGKQSGFISDRIMALYDEERKGWIKVQDCEHMVRLVQAVVNGEQKDGNIWFIPEGEK